MADESAGREQRLRRIGRRLGIGVFGLVVAGITLLWTIQIMTQAWSGGETQGVLPADCRKGVLELATALKRARKAAAQEPNGERAALSRFRAALLPEWAGRATLEPSCKGDAQALQTLKQLSALRYAEEHAVRYEAVALAAQRRRVDALARALLQKGPDAL